jgi:hypothetical protein
MLLTNPVIFGFNVTFVKHMLSSCLLSHYELQGSNMGTSIINSHLLHVLVKISAGFGTDQPFFGWLLRGVLLGCHVVPLVSCLPSFKI